jgi:hypothetical protein
MAENEALETKRKAILGVKVFSETLIALACMVKAASFDTGGKLSLPATVNGMCIFLAIASAVISLMLFGAAMGGKSPDSSKVTGKLIAFIRNALILMLYSNAVVQLGANDGFLDKGATIEVVSLLRAGLLLVSKTVLEPLLDVKDITHVSCDYLDASIAGKYTYRFLIKLMVLGCLAFSAVMLIVDIANKGYAEGSDSIWFAAGSLSVISVHILLVIYGIIANKTSQNEDGSIRVEAKESMKFLLFSPPAGSECADDQTLHGLNEIPVVRAFVVAITIGLISLLLGDEMQAGDDISVTILPLCSMMVADLVGRNVA